MNIKKIITFLLCNSIIALSLSAKLPLTYIKGLAQPTFKSLVLSPLAGALMEQSPYAKNLYLAETTKNHQSF